MSSLALEYRIGKSTCHEVISSTCAALWEELQPVYLREPSREDFQRIAEGYEEKWNFANCVGAIDGKLIRVICPAHSGSDFWCYKKYFAINLMACCDHNLIFTYVDIGAQGGLSDGGVFRHSEFGQLIIDHDVPVPLPKVLPRDTGSPFPHFFVADEAFPQRVNLMRPYPRAQQLSLEEKVFNYRLSRARFTIENAFGLLAAKWRIFHREIETSCAEHAESIVKAAVVLHNYVLMTATPANRQPMYDEDGRMVVPEAENALGNRFEDIVMAEGRNHTREASSYKDRLRDYLFSPRGAIPWQVQRVQRRQ